MNTERDILIERFEKELNFKDKQLKEAKESLTHFLEEKNKETTQIEELENRINKIERKISEISNGYDGVMRELLDQKSLIKNLTKTPTEPTKPTQASQENKITIAPTPQNKQTTPEADGIIIAEENPTTINKNKNKNKKSQGHQNSPTDDDIIEV